MTNATALYATALNAIVTEANSPACPESQFLTELVGGDATALERWFHEHQSGVYAFAYFRLGRDPDLAADATQATFATALERLGEFDPLRGGMTVWLRTLARNIIRRLLAQHRSSRQLEGDEHRIDETLRQAWRQIDSQPLPEALCQRQQTRELVTMTLATLPPQYQAVLQARYVDGQPLEAIAQRRKTTLDGAKSMLRRARAAFREAFLGLTGIDVSEK